MTEPPGAELMLLRYPTATNLPSDCATTSRALSEESPPKAAVTLPPLPNEVSRSPGAACSEVIKQRITVKAKNNLIRMDYLLKIFLMIIGELIKILHYLLICNLFYDLYDLTEDEKNSKKN